MAKDCSFDVVSEFDKQELVNAIDQVKRDITSRFDLKNSNSNVELEADKCITVTTNDDMKLRNIYDILQSKLVKRNLSLKILDPQKVENALGGNVKQEIKNIRNKFDNVSMNSDENLKNLELSNNEQKLTFISDNTDVAIVSNGIVYNQGIGKSTIYVYDQTELVDTFTVEVNEVAKKKGCSNTVVVDVLLLSSALSIVFILLKKKH